MSGSICNTVPAAILANSWSILNKHTIKNYPSGAHLPRIRPLSIFFWEMCIFSLPRPWAPLRRSLGNTNQWFAGSAVFWQDKLDTPLKARHLKTAPQVTPGKANGAATFTMSYQ